MKEKDQLILILFGAVLFILLALYLAVLMIANKRRQHKNILKNLEHKHELNRQLLQSRIETQERSFQYFSEEIHDNVGQILSVVGMQLYQLQAECTGERAAALLKNSSELLNKAINDLRAISHTLNTRYSERAGLQEALQKEIDYVNAFRQVVARVEVKGDPVELGTERETLLFRIVQEAINNAMKHANASLITIELVFDDRLTVSIRDNGTVYDPGTIAAHTEFGPGFSNMELRARLLGGQLLLEQASGKGTSVSLTININ